MTPCRWLRAAMVCVALSIAPAWAAEQDLVTLNFVNADIEGVIKAMGQITGKNFVLDPRVKGTVTIISSQPVAKALVYDLFLSALRLQGFAAAEERGIVKILPAADAKFEAPVAAGARAAGDRVQTQVFTLKYESAAQLVPVLRPLIAPYNTVTAYAANNTLVVTDYAGNLARIARIIEAIDQPSGPEPVVIPLQHASAVDVAQTVGRLFTEGPQGAGAAAPQMTVVADARSNSLVARSDDSLRLARLRGLVAVLDAPTSAVGNIHVVYLKNAEAVKVAETLRAIYLGDTGASVSVSRASTSAAPEPPPPPSTAGASPMNTSFSQFSKAQSTTPLTPGIVQADPATNAIIINAPDAIFNSLRAALEKLDVRRAQVYVEALIAEISSDKAAEFGIQWQYLGSAGATDSTSRAFGGTNFGGTGQNVLGISQNPASAGPGLNIGVIRGRVTIPGVGEIANIAALVRALESDTNTNILSTPRLLTLDNEEARIVIGQNLPILTGQYALTGGATTPTPFQTIERQDVGLTLRIKPQISEGGTVRLQLYEEVSSVASETAAGPVTNKRAVQSTILVDDGEIVAIGGLLQDSLIDGEQKVPVLGDLPLVGGLFRYNTRSHVKTNLMLFLRPVVLRDSPSASSIAAERYKYFAGEQNAFEPAQIPGLPDLGRPTLPSDSMWNLPR
jgi:general secretion pathway protein D